MPAPAKGVVAAVAEAPVEARASSLGIPPAGGMGAGSAVVALALQAVVVAEEPVVAAEAAAARPVASSGAIGPDSGQVVFPVMILPFPPVPGASASAVLVPAAEVPKRLNAHAP